MAIIFFKKLFKSRNLRGLISISLDLTKKLEQSLGPSESSGPSGPFMYGYLFFKIDCLNLGTFRTFGTLYIFLSFFEFFVLISEPSESWRPFIFSLDLTNTLEQFSGPSGPSGPLEPYMYGYLYIF